MDDMVIRRSSPSTKCNSSRKRKLQHLCLDKAYNSRMVKTGHNQTGLCSPHTLQEKQGPENRGDTPKEISFCQKQAMGCGENKLMMAQQVQETVHKVWEEGWELSWLGTAVMQHHNLQKDNFGIGSKSKIYPYKKAITVWVNIVYCWLHSNHSPIYHTKSLKTKMALIANYT